MIERAGAYPIVNDANNAFASAFKVVDTDIATAKRIVKSWIQVIDFYCSPGPEFSNLVARTVAGIDAATDRESLNGSVKEFEQAFIILFKGIEKDAMDLFDWFTTFYDETYFHMTYID